MGLLEKILAKDRANEAISIIAESKAEVCESADDISIEDFPLAPVEFDGATFNTLHTLRKENSAKRDKKENAQGQNALKLSTKSLLKLQDELKNLTVMQVEKLDGDIIPKGIITGKFEIERTMDSKRWLFSLMGNNGSALATSRVYSAVSAAMNGIQSVIANAKKAPIEDQTLKTKEILPFPKWVIYLDTKERFNFILYASNGNSVIHSHGYSSKSAAKKGIESVIGACKNPMIEKTYLHNKED